MKISHILFNSILTTYLFLIYPLLADEEPLATTIPLSSEWTNIIEQVEALKRPTIPKKSVSINSQEVAKEYVSYLHFLSSPGWRSITQNFKQRNQYDPHEIGQKYAQAIFMAHDLGETMPEGLVKKKIDSYIINWANIIDKISENRVLDDSIMNSFSMTPGVGVLNLNSEISLVSNFPDDEWTTTVMTFGDTVHFSSTAATSNGDIVEHDIYINSYSISARSARNPQGLGYTHTLSLDIASHQFFDASDLQDNWVRVTAKNSSEAEIERYYWVYVSRAALIPEYEDQVLLQGSSFREDMLTAKFINAVNSSLVLTSAEEGINYYIMKSGEELLENLICIPISISESGLWIEYLLHPYSIYQTIEELPPGEYPLFAAYIEPIPEDAIHHTDYFEATIEKKLIILDPNDRITDTDQDGLPDVWELTHFGSIKVVTGSTVFDSASGLTYGDAYRFGIDPTKSLSDQASAFSTTYTYTTTSRLASWTVPESSTQIHTYDLEGNIDPVQ